ncbi:Vms1/Ankzf1 family peptidyl-tRNA hydrolase [Halorussus rarus]|uniref:Vms1/Ankzf1 family peptidyl-tRNA hydrolase n=1 Tax=Halorussus TaxID=1070314 RepID=UPI001F079DBD|nr:Vms1/Ankzf1 family peptidyl-tRNA hydrolase [Halorussus rarus]
MREPSHGEVRAGGQSAQRFERERERQAHEFFQKVGDIANEALIGDDAVTGLVIGGTLATAKKFVSGDYLDHRLKDRLLGTYPVEYGNTQGLHQLVDKAESRLLDAEQQEAREHLDKFYSRLRGGGTVAYGSTEVEQAIEYGAVETALVASSVPRDEREELETEVSQQGGELCVTSTDTERGAQLADNFGGIGALLRFPIK